MIYIINLKKARASTKERTLTIPMSIVRKMYSMCHRRHAGIIFKVERSCPGVAGSWAGGVAGAKVGAMGGAAIGTAICPGLGTAIGGFVGGLVGGIAGALGGRAAGEGIAKAAYR